MSEGVRLPESKRILFEKYLAQKTRKVSSEPEPIPQASAECTHSALILAATALAPFADGFRSPGV